MTYDSRHNSERPHGQGRGEDMFDSPNPTRLYRSRKDNVIAGVCGGIANRFGWDPILVRLLAVASFFLFAGPLVIIGYIVMWMVTPKAPMGGRTMAPDEEAFWRGVSDRPKTTYSGLKYTFMDLEDRLQGLERKVTSDEWRLRREFRDLERN